MYLCEGLCGFVCVCVLGGTGSSVKTVGTCISSLLGRVALEVSVPGQAFTSSQFSLEGQGEAGPMGFSNL